MLEIILASYFKILGYRSDNLLILLAVDFDDLSLMIFVCNHVSASCKMWFIVMTLLCAD